MMNRRARIKGIANIPVRRKNDASANENVKQQQSVSSEKQNVEEKLETNGDTANGLENQFIQNDTNKTEIPLKNHEPSQQIISSNNSSNNLESISDECRNITSVDNKTISKLDSVNSDVNNKTDSNTVSRRWIPKPKPMVKNPTVLRRPKPVLLPLKEKSESVLNQNIENETPTEILETTEKSPVPVQNLVTESQEIRQCQTTPTESILKSPTEPEKNITSPLSPSKILNRTRIRPSPKLIRRNSVQGSASESEDDGRRSRIRNDSVCSTASYTTEIVSVKENTIISKDKLISIKVHKLFRRSEQSRRVAEARKDFYQKFGTNIPDRKRLTMMDLIYYNPTGNPMAERKQSTTIEEIIEDETETVEEEKEDDPEEAEVEEEDATPVPQVKVGPNGEIILDEQSLVIEQTGTKKGREKLANSQIVNADDLDRVYGVYKRPKRSKDWSAIETLRFYRSLNTVGTDFSLMVSLFPGRTRRELKMKFKKEEKINRQLIDKALTNPVDFDLSELERQLKEEEEIMKKLEEEQKNKKRKAKIPRIKYKTSMLASHMQEEIDDDTKVEKTSKVRPTRMRKPKKDRYSALKISELSTSESEDSETESPRKIQKTEDDKYTTRVYLRKRDTLKENSKDLHNILLKDENISPKKELNTCRRESEQNNNEDEETKGYCNETNDDNIDETDEDMEEEIDKINDESDDNEAEKIDNENPPENDQNCAIPNILPNDLSTVEPGSLMILSSTGPDGQQIFKVFMVTPGQAKVPVNLSDDVVQSLTSSLGSAQAVTLDLPVINDSDNQEILTDAV